MKSIDLGRKMSPIAADGDEVYYPVAHIDGSKDLDLPDAGLITFKFRKIRSEKSVSNGETRYSCTLELRKIKDVEAYEEGPRKDDRSEHLDKLAEEEAKHSDDY